MPWHIVIAVTALAALAGSLRADGETSQLHHHGAEIDMDPSVEIPPPSAGLRGPYFEPSASKNVTALVGKTAYLNCRVRNLGNRTVSWVRHRDIHLLTVGRYTYTSDQRFQSIHSPQTEDWMLQVRYPQRRDSGIYECQVSTTPPIGHSMYLSVVVNETSRNWYKKSKTQFRVLRFYEDKGQYHSLDKCDHLKYSIRLAIQASTRSKIPILINVIGRHQNNDSDLKQISLCGFAGYLFHLRMNWKIGEIVTIIKKLNVNLLLYNITPRYPAFCIATRGSCVFGGPINDIFPFDVDFGDIIYLTTLDEYELESCHECLYINYKPLPDVVKVGDFLFIENGSIPLRVEGIQSYRTKRIQDDRAIKCTVLLSGTINEYTQVYFPNHIPDLPEIHPMDKVKILKLLPFGLNTIFLSKCHSPDTIRQVRELIDSTGVYDSSRYTIIANISSKMALERIDEIIELADGIHFNQSELNIQIGFIDVFLNQKKVMCKCLKKGKIILAPLNIMPIYIYGRIRWRNYIPRAPQEDIANLYLNGLDGTIIYGNRYGMSQLKRTATSIKSRLSIIDSIVWNKPLYNDFLRQFERPHSVEEGLSIAVLQVGFKIDATAIIFFENEGRFARTISRLKPRCAVMVVTTSLLNARNIVIRKPLMPILTKNNPAKTWDITQECYIQFGIDYGKKNDIIQSRDAIIAILRPQEGALFNEYRAIYLSCA